MNEVPLPDIRLELLEDLSPQHEQGFLRLVRRRLRAHYPDGSVSAPFVYDEVDRKAIDAVVIVAYHVPAAGRPGVYLRSALRPPVVFRDRSRSALPELDPRGSIWELPAGLVESDEQSASGIRRAAQRELLEEVGFDLPEHAFWSLGPSTFPAAGFIAERHYFFAAAVDPSKRGEPALDGSALETAGVVHLFGLGEALAMCRDGRIVDAKTELGVRRLVESLP